MTPRPFFETLLRAFPAPFRSRFGEAMLDDFEAACQDRRDEPTRLLAFQVRTAVDMIWAGLKERLRPTLIEPAAGLTDALSGARFSLLDARVGLRILVKHPVLTSVTVFALAIGIPVGLAPNHLATALEAPLPVPGGERIRLLRYWNPLTSRPEPTNFRDLQEWREHLTSFETLGAARGAAYNIASEKDFAAPVPGAEVTASTFDILRVRPQLGRTLTAGDEEPGAAPVALIGYDLWRSRFAFDPEVVGRDLRIGGVPHTIVGVMPEEFRFPTDHQLWLPLGERIGPENEGLPLTIFGRLAEGIGEPAAQAQLSTLGRRHALASAQANTELQPELMPYSYWSARVMGGPKGGLKATPEFYIAQTLALGLLLVACVNVSMLIFARTTARAAELSVRTALGASRSRIITQVFTESLVLALVSSAFGLMLLDRLPSRLITMATDAEPPRWLDLGVGPETVMWTLALSLLSAALVGIVPALSATRRTVRSTIQRAQAGPSGGRFGGLSGVLIVADVAIAVTAVGLAAGLSYQLGESWNGREATGIEARQFLSAELSFPAGAEAERTAATAGRRTALVERIEAEPGVRGVTVATALPRMDHPTRFVEVEGRTHEDGVQARRVRIASVTPGFFDVLGHPVLRGRGFEANDLADGSTAVIVNNTFVTSVLGGENPIGKRIRYRTRSGEGEPGPWQEIVGVVGRLGMHVLNPEGDEGVYHPLRPGSEPVYLAIHLQGAEPGSFGPRLRALAAEVDPTASIGTTRPLDQVLESDWYSMAALALGGSVLVALLLALAASGIYAIMSFAVAARTREIGIRSALGARRRDIAFTVARRALGQIGLGALLGTPVAGRIFFEILRDAGFDHSTYLTVAVALTPGVAVMLLVGLIACTAPTLRALRVAPSEALRV